MRNLYYKSKKNPDLNWDVKNIEKADGTKILFMNDDPQNLVLKTFSIKFSQEQTYYFNLNNKGNGFMSMINMRWNSFLDSINGQSLYFCTCKGLK